MKITHRWSQALRHAYFFFREPMHRIHANDERVAAGSTIAVHALAVCGHCPFAIVE
jgi:hypothetical protein